jgi:hypothetical protein
LANETGTFCDPNIGQRKALRKQGDVMELTLERVVDGVAELNSGLEKLI